MRYKVKVNRKKGMRGRPDRFIHCGFEYTAGQKKAMIVHVLNSTTSKDISHKFDIKPRKIPVSAMEQGAEVEVFFCVKGGS